MSLMNGAGWQFYTYRDETGNGPVWDFLERDITSGEKGQILSRMLTVMEHGPTVKGNILENLGNGLYVLRIPNTPNNPRVFICPIPSRRGNFVMLHAYKKHGKKIPDSEMRIARKRQKEVQNQPLKYIIWERQ